MTNGLLYAGLYTIFTLFVWPLILWPDGAIIIYAGCALVGWIPVLGLLIWDDVETGSVEARATAQSSGLTKILPVAYIVISGICFFADPAETVNTGTNTKNAACSMPGFVNDYNKGTSGANRINCK